jgi:hypothetical protein
MVLDSTEIVIFDFCANALSTTLITSVLALSMFGFSAMVKCEQDCMSRVYSGGDIRGSIRTKEHEGGRGGQP